MKIMRHLAIAFAVMAGLVSPALAQGTIPIALQQSVNANGQPLSGALLYIFSPNTTVLTSVFQDAGLSIPASNPLVADANGRLPMFYLASGSVHARLTDSSGVVQFDYPSMLVIGAAGGGGGGTPVDPTTVAATGDYKWRASTEILTGWVKANGLTIGSAVSGASGRANGDTQSLFINLWTNCPNTHCPVSGGRGGSGLADFNANKTIQLPDCRSRICGVGLDDMGNSPAGRMLASNVTSGGGDTTTTPNATGGEANHTLTLFETPSFNYTPSGTITFSNTPSPAVVGTAGGSFASGGLVAPAGVQNFSNNATFNGATVAIGGSGGSHNVMQPFMLGTWYVKL